MSVEQPQKAPHLVHGEEVWERERGSEYGQVVELREVQHGLVVSVSSQHDAAIEQDERRKQPSDGDVWPRTPQQAPRQPQHVPAPRVLHCRAEEAASLLVGQVLLVRPHQSGDDPCQVEAGHEHHPDDVGLTQGDAEGPNDGSQTVTRVKTEHVHEEDEERRAAVRVVEEREEVERREEGERAGGHQPTHLTVVLQTTHVSRL